MFEMDKNPSDTAIVSGSPRRKILVLSTQKHRRDYRKTTRKCLASEQSICLFKLKICAEGETSLLILEPGSSGSPRNVSPRPQVTHFRAAL